MEGRIEVDLDEQLRSLLSHPDRQVFVGTDSQNDRSRTEFVTVVCVHTVGKGGRVFYCHERMPRIKSLRERLMREVWMSVETGITINGVIPEDRELTIHIDVNPNLKYKSSVCVKEAVGLVQSQGFGYVLKPDSSVASHVADHILKERIVGR